MAVTSSNIAHCTEKQYKVLDSAVTVDGTAVADSTAIDFRRYSSGEFTVPTGSSITTLTFFAAHEDVDASYVAAYTTGNTAVTMTVAAARRYPLPASLAGSHYIRATGNASGTITNVVLKG